jgi:hypothetical protein
MRNLNIGPDIEGFSSSAGSRGAGGRGRGRECPGSRPRGGAQLRREHAHSRGEGQLECKIYSQLRWTRPLDNRYRKLPRFTRKLPSVQLFPNLKSARFGSCPGLTIKERTEATDRVIGALRPEREKGRLMG